MSEASTALSEASTALSDAASSLSEASAPSYTCAEAREASAGATPLPLGVYTKCTGSAVDSNESAGGNATGTLTLTESGGVLSVALGEGLFAIAPGSLGFTPLTNGAAVVTPGQSYGLLVVPCATSTAETGALALEGSSLVLSLLGQGCGNPMAASSNALCQPSRRGSSKQPTFATMRTPGRSRFLAARTRNAQPRSRDMGAAR
jgi:hypothetical protein